MLRAGIPEPRATVVLQELHVLRKGHVVLMQLGIVEHMAVGHQQIQVSVQVIVQRHNTEPHPANAGLPQPGRQAAIHELAVALVGIQRVGLHGHVGDEQVGVTVAVEVLRLDAHAGFRHAVLVHGAAAEQPDLLELPCPIQEQEVGRPVIGHV